MTTLQASCSRCFLSITSPHLKVTCASAVDLCQARLVRITPSCLLFGEGRGLDQTKRRQDVSDTAAFRTTPRVPRTETRLGLVKSDPGQRHRTAVLFVLSGFFFFFFFAFIRMALGLKYANFGNHIIVLIRNDSTELQYWSNSLVFLLKQETERK